MNKIEKRVARGCAYLDRKSPGWEDRITKPVDLTSSRDCVIGQVFGDYWVHIGIGEAPTVRGFLKYISYRCWWAMRRGFDGPGEPGPVEAEWTRVIRLRKAQRTLREAEVLAEAMRVVLDAEKVSA
jgi:hypothetical protein